MSNSNFTITRRDFLKYLGIGALALLVPDRTPRRVRAYSQVDHLARVPMSYVRVYDRPSDLATVVGFHFFNEVLKVPDPIFVKDKEGKTNPWYQMGKNKFIYAGFMQEVQNIRNVTTQPIPDEGCLGEITVPIIDVYDSPRGIKTNRLFYYSSTFWVIRRLFDDYKIPWYELLDDQSGLSYFVKAYAVRLVTPEELTPISPDVPMVEKRIELDLRHQKLVAFERNKPIKTIMVSAGLEVDATPIGTFMTNRKRPCRRMVDTKHGTYDLPGVPWVSYFTLDGVSFHGAYWHSNWGHGMSHGCVNMSPESAKWLYRWCDPNVPFDKYFFQSDTGTRVDVISTL